MSSFDDEEFARRLQQEEYENQRRAEENQRLADAEFARKLASQAEPGQQTIRPPLSSAAVAQMSSGQTIAIRLQHPATGNQVDAALYAHYLDRNIMMFEMVSNPGSFLRTRGNGKVEFSQILDDKARYRVSGTPNGTIYLENRGGKHKTNVDGTEGWNLALQPDGSMMGNASKTSMAQWRLVAATDAPPYDPSMSPLHTSVRQSIVNSSSSASSQSASPPASPANSMGRTHSGLSSEVHVGTRKSQRAQAAAESLNEIPTVQASVNQQLQWLSSRVGQMFLERQPVLKHMYNAGTLRRVLHRPDWHTTALTWKDYAAEPIPYNPSAADALTNPMAEWFFDQGYVQCEAIIPPKIIANALRIINFWIGQEMLPRVSPVGNVELTEEILMDQDVLAVLYESPLIHMVQKLLGVGQVKPCVRASISLRFPQLGDPSPSPTTQGSKRGELGGRRWFVDGANSSEEEPYSILIAVPLNTISQPFEGNLCVFPEAHFKTHETMIKSSQGKGGSGGSFNMTDELDMSKPDMGEPTQVQMRVGDALLLPGMLMPRRDSPNYSANIRYMVYFRVAARRQTPISELATDGLWADFSPSVAPRSQRKKNVATAGGTFSL